MQPVYKHTQYGALMFGIFIVVAILIAVVAWAIISEGRIAAAIIMICVYLLGVSLFYSFTVEVKADRIKFWFGIGIFRKAYMLNEIKSTRQVKNPWYYFLGSQIHPRWLVVRHRPGRRTRDHS